MPVDTTPPLPTTGTEIQFTMLKGGRPVLDTKVLWVSGSVNERAQQYQDKYMGRLRDRLDKKTLGYDGNFTFDVANFSVLDALRDIDAQREAYRTIPDLAFTFAWSLRDGTSAGFALIKATATFNLNMGGKDERNKLALNVQAEDWHGVTL